MRGNGVFIKRNSLLLFYGFDIFMSTLIKRKPNMSQHNHTEDHVGTSKFYMLRCIIVMAHSDGIVCDEERAYIAALTNRLPLTSEQREILQGDLDKAQDISLLFAHINEPKYRAQVVYFARIMAYKDGVKSPDEEDLLKKLHSYAIDGLNMEQIKGDVEKAVNAELLVHDISIIENRPSKSGHPIPWLQWLDELLLALGIDLVSF